MLIKEILETTPTALSFEFFPPKTPEETDLLFETVAELKTLKPHYVSVTYGAGGSTREFTHRLSERIQTEAGLTVVAHLTCVGASRAETQTILEGFEASGITNILALRGDPPKGQRDWRPAPDGFEHAVDLVAFIRKNFPRMGVGIAGFPEGHPGTPNRLLEMDHLKAKVDAGADYIVTQLFFDNRDFDDFRARCELAGIDVPIIAGLMPIATRSAMVRTAELAAGSKVPAGLLRAIGRTEDDVQVEKVGAHWAAEQVRDLLDHRVRGVHLYTLNRSTATLRIFESLGIRDSGRFQV